MSTQDEKWDGDRCQLKENTEVELKQVSGGSNITKNNEGIVDKVSGGVNISNYNGEIKLNKNNGYIVEKVISESDDNDVPVITYKPRRWP